MLMKLMRGYSKREFLNMLVLFTAYIVASEAGVLLYTAGDPLPAIIWAPVGIAIAGIFMGGTQLWPAIVLASFLSNIINGNAILISFITALVAAIQAILGVLLLRHFGFDRSLSRMSDPLALITTAFVVSPILPFVVVVLRHISGSITSIESSLPIFVAWWVGNTMSVLILVPFLLKWIPVPAFDRTMRQYVEIFSTSAITLFFTTMLFWSPYASIANIPIIYFLLIPLFWIAIRTGARVMTLTLFLITIIALSGVFYSPYDSGLAGLAETLVQTQMLLIILAISFLLFTSIEEERKRAVSKLAEKVEVLEGSLEKASHEDRAKNDFIAILAHELRNPLAPILNSIELIKMRGIKAKESKDSLGLIENRVLVIASLLDDLLDISRISHRKFSLARQAIDAAEAVRKVAESAKVLLEGYGHKLTLRTPKRPIWINADPLRMEQIVMNMVSNAAKYTPRGGHIWIEAYEQAGNAIIRVIDDGVGIRSDTMKHIFEPFQQLPSTRRSEGLGIGLFLTKRLAELHNGSISAHSEGEGCGSAFTVSIPLSNPPLFGKHGTERKKGVSKSPARNMRVLVVDDNKAAADSIAKLLAHKNYDVDVAYTGKDALASATKNAPSAILLDLELPDISGQAVARILRAEYKFAGTIIALSGYGQERDRKSSRESGFDHHLVKPAGIYEIEKLLAEKDGGLFATATRQKK